MFDKLSHILDPVSGTADGHYLLYAEVFGKILMKSTIYIPHYKNLSGKYLPFVASVQHANCMLMISVLNTHDLAQLISIIYRVIITDYGTFWQVQ